MARKFEDLSPINYVTQLNERKNELERVIKLKKVAIKRSKFKDDKGHIRIVPHHRTFQFYLITKVGDTRGKYLPREKNDYAKGLIKLDYERKAIKAMEKEIAAIKKLLSIAKNNSVEKVGSRFSKARRSLVSSVTLSDEEFAKEWESVSYSGKHFDYTSTEYYTSKGERVRSKSEVIIADTLARMKIPYRYEFPLELKNKTFPIYPDFCCLNLKTRKEVYWEHFGMMDDQEYANKAVNKIRELQENGFYAGDNAIFTFETSGLPLNSRYIERIAEKVLA